MIRNFYANLLQFDSGTNTRHTSSNYTHTKICVRHLGTFITCGIFVRNPEQEAEVQRMPNKVNQEKRVHAEEEWNDMIVVQRTKDQQEGNFTSMN